MITSANGAAANGRNEKANWRRRADALAAELEAAYPADRLRTLVAQFGLEKGGK